MKGIKAGFAICGSFCTIKDAIKEIENLTVKGIDVIPIMSPIVYETDNRFNNAAELRDMVEMLCNNKIIHTIPQAEPIGPKKMLDILIVAPCTGNTMAKVAYGITDTSVTMAVKAHLRNNRPVVIAPATNDALSAGAQNIGRLLNVKNIYFVPYGQDDPFKKCTSLIADFTKIPLTVEYALEGKQLQPLLLK
ncbi:MAG: dipicolinate synthase subunit B [Clostridia bacterium]|nr:dipicolinate synthase subunit B [Clostridia bacterium]